MIDCNLVVFDGIKIRESLDDNICRKCGAYPHRPQCEMPDLIQLLSNLDEVFRVFGREKLEAYGLLKSVDKMYEILNRRAGLI